MKTFKQHFIEAAGTEEELKDNNFSTNLPGGYEVSGNVYDLLKFVKRYPVEKISGTDLKKLIKVSPIFDKSNMGSMYKGKFVPLNDLPEIEKRKALKDEEERTMKSDLSFPIIVAGTKEHPISILDGNHRLEKVVKTKTGSILVKYIPVKDLKKF